MAKPCTVFLPWMTKPACETRMAGFVRVRYTAPSFQYILTKVMQKSVMDFYISDWQSAVLPIPLNARRFPNAPNFNRSAFRARRHFMHWARTVCFTSRCDGMFYLGGSMRAKSSRVHACACAYALVCVLLLAGCGQRIHAEVSAVVEQGYQAGGQTFALALMPGFAVEDPAAARAAVETTLAPALQDMGYVTAAAGQSPDVLVRVWWFSTGPHPVYRRVEWRDRRYWHRHYGYRRQAVVVEDEYARYLVVEGIGMEAPLPATKPGELKAGTSPATTEVAAETGPVADSAEQSIFTSPQEAARALPAAPARLLWRVRVESRGNLARAERVLQPLAAAAAPFMGKSGVVHVLVQEGEVVASEAVAP